MLKLLRCAVLERQIGEASLFHFGIYLALHELLYNDLGIKVWAVVILRAFWQAAFDRRWCDAWLAGSEAR